MPRPPSPEAGQLEALLSAAVAITPMTTSELEDAATAAGLWLPGRIYAALVHLERQGRVRGLRLGSDAVLWAATVLRSHPPRSPGSR